MPDLPEEAVQAADEAWINSEGLFGKGQMDHALAAAYPFIAAHVRMETLRDVAQGRVTLDEHAAAQGHTQPQRIEDLHTDLALTSAAMEEFMSGSSRPDNETEIRADERRKVAEQIAAAIDARRCDADRRFCADCVCRPEDAALARQIGEGRV